MTNDKVMTLVLGVLALASIVGACVVEALTGHAAGGLLATAAAAVGGIAGSIAPPRPSAKTPANGNGNGENGKNP